MAVTVELEGVGDIESVISSNVVTVVMESTGDIDSTLTYDRNVTAIVEGSGEIFAPLITESIVKSFTEGSGQATDHGLFSAITGITSEGEGEVTGQSLISYMESLPAEGIGDVTLSVLASFVMLLPSEGRGEVNSVSAWGYITFGPIGGESETISREPASYRSPSSIIGNGEIDQDIISLFRIVVGVWGDGDVGSTAKTESIVKTYTEGVAEIPSGVLDLISSVVLALYGKNSQAAIFNNYPFDSFIEHNGVTYASSVGGVYEVGVSTDDDGDDISPEVVVDLRKLGENTIKQIKSIFSDDGSKCTVDLDGITQDYTSSGNGKFYCKYNHTGKNLKVTFSDFDSLSDVEIFLTNLSRFR